MTDNNPEGGLTPTDLEPSNEHVRQLDDGRRVVNTDGGDAVPPDGGPEPQPAGSHEVHGHDGQSGVETVPGAETAPGAHADVAALTGAHALVAGARADDTEDTVVADTDDVSEAFESLVCWYADTVAEDQRPETVLAGLLEHTALDIEVSPQ